MLRCWAAWRSDAVFLRVVGSRYRPATLPYPPPPFSPRPPVQEHVPVPVTGRPVVGGVATSLRAAHGGAQRAAVRRHQVCQPARGVGVAVERQRHERNALQLHPAPPSIPQAGEDGPGQRRLRRGHVDEVCAQRGRAVRVRAGQAELHAPTDVVGVPEGRVRGRAAVGAGQRTVGVAAAFAGVTLVCVFFGGGR